MWNAGVVDRVQQFVAPVELGPAGVPWLEDVMTELRDLRTVNLGPDTMTEGYVQRID